MSDKTALNTHTDEELMERINDCRIRILEELGCDVPESLNASADHESD